MLEEDPKNILHYQCQVESYMNLVLEIYLHDKHEYAHGIFRSVIPVSKFTFTGLFSFFFVPLRIAFQRNIFLISF